MEEPSIYELFKDKDEYARKLNIFCEYILDQNIKILKNEFGSKYDDLIIKNIAQSLKFDVFSVRPVSNRNEMLRKAEKYLGLLKKAENLMFELELVNDYQYFDENDNLQKIDGDRRIKSLIKDAERKVSECAPIKLRDTDKKSLSSTTIRKIRAIKMINYSCKKCGLSPSKSLRAIRALLNYSDDRENNKFIKEAIKTRNIPVNLILTTPKSGIELDSKNGLPISIKQIIL
ncbi:hypothetical protein ABE427_01870 [Acinetobacter higginsii]|uniref:hypothetical protein n=1 Tax=Acinetobacter higginsii TaxID=70347 RepID=UPI00320B3905